MLWRKKEISKVKPTKRNKKFKPNAVTLSKYFKLKIKSISKEN